MKHVIHRLQAYIDDELDRHQRESVEEHCERCPACARELETLRSVWDQITAAKAPALERPLWPLVNRRLAERARSRVGSTGLVTGRWQPRLVRFGLATAAVAGGLAVGLTVGRLDAVPGSATWLGGSAGSSDGTTAVTSTLLEESASLVNGDWTLDQLWLAAIDEEESGT